MKANLLVGSQEPGDHVTLRYIDGKEQPRFPVPAIPLTVFLGKSIHIARPVEIDPVHGQMYEVVSSYKFIPV